MSLRVGTGTALADPRCLYPREEADLKTYFAQEIEQTTMRGLNVVKNKASCVGV